MIMLNGKRIDGAVGDALPIGTLSPFVGLVAPKGYLICMGQLVDKAKYPELWELCGDTFGPSTTTQFYLPDLRGQTIAGYKQGDSTFGTLGALIGSKTTPYTPVGTNSGGAVGNHTLTAAESGMPTHKHNIVNSDVMIWCGTWGIQGNQGFASGTQSIGSVGAKALGKYVTTDDITGVSASSAHNHGFTNPTFTGTQANISTVQPTAIMNWIIKASMIAVIESNVEDSLTSTSSTDALSAKQGKVLKDLVDTNNGLAFKKNAIKTVQKRLTTDVAGNCVLGMDSDNEIILSIYQLGTDANCWVTLYCYNGLYFVHTGDWNGSAFSGTATFEIVYIDRNDL